MIRAGVTCFGDMYHYFEAAARAVIDSGMRAVVSGVLLGFLPNADELLDTAIAFAKDWQNKGDGRLVTMLGPHAPYTVADRFLVRVVEEPRRPASECTSTSRRRGVRWRTACATTVELRCSGSTRSASSMRARCWPPTAFT